MISWCFSYRISANPSNVPKIFSKTFKSVSQHFKSQSLPYFNCTNKTVDLYLMIYIRKINVYTYLVKSLVRIIFIQLIFPLWYFFVLSNDCGIFHVVSYRMYSFVIRLENESFFCCSFLHCDWEKLISFKIQFDMKIN